MAREATLTVETMERENTRDIPIRITASYIFAGPAVQPGKDCFQCFRRSLEDNESYLAGILQNGTEDRDGLNDFELECLESLDREELRAKSLFARQTSIAKSLINEENHPEAVQALKEYFKEKSFCLFAAGITQLFPSDRGGLGSPEELFSALMPAFGNAGIGMCFFQDENRLVFHILCTISGRAKVGGIDINALFLSKLFQIRTENSRICAFDGVSEQVFRNDERALMRHISAACRQSVSCADTVAECDIVVSFFCGFCFCRRCCHSSSCDYCRCQYYR